MSAEPVLSIQRREAAPRFDSVAGSDLPPEVLAAVRPHLPSFRFVLDDPVARTGQDLRAGETAVLGWLRSCSCASCAI